MPHEPAQFDATKMSLRGVHSIAASAGTGKTHTITTLYLRYLMQTEHRVEQILVTTFTEAATLELKDRLRTRVREALEVRKACPTLEAAHSKVKTEGRSDLESMIEILNAAGAWDEDSPVQGKLEAAMLSFDHAPIFTIHGFCSRVLNELIFETSSRFEAELLTSQDLLVEEALNDFIAQTWAEKNAPLTPWLPLDGTLLDLLKAVARDAIDNRSWDVAALEGSLDDVLDPKVLEAFAQTSSELGRLWKTQGDDIRTLLLNALSSKELDGRSFRAKGVEDSLGWLGAFVANPDLDQFRGSGGEPGAKHKRLSASFLKEKTKKGCDTPKHELFDVMDQLLDVVATIAELVQKIRPLVLEKFVGFIRGHIDRKKEEGNVLAFSDLLHEVDLALGGSQGDALKKVLRKQYQVVLVDEFQDTDPIQYRIFRRLFQEACDDADAGAARAFVLIGDPKQSIYQFRGADIKSYLRATKDTPSEQQHTMDTNWRSDDSLVKAVQALFSSVKNPFLDDDIPLPEVRAHYEVDRMRDGPALDIVLVPRAATERSGHSPRKSGARKQVLSRVVHDIVEQLNAPPVILDSAGEQQALSPGDLAVLCRKGKDLRSIQQALGLLGVPAILQTNESIFDTFEAEAVGYVLQALIHPGRTASIAAALQSPLIGLNACELERVRLAEDEQAKWSERFQQWRTLWYEHGFVLAWRKLLDDLDVLPRLAKEVIGERQITNFLHLGELLHRQTVDAHAGPEQLYRWLRQTMEQDRNRSDEQRQIRLETDAEAVTLCTIHRSKGLEYKVVYCPTLWDAYEGKQKKYAIARVDEDGHALEVPLIDLGTPLLEQRLLQNQDESQQEDRRLLYVALTRAKHQCRLYWTATNKSNTTALGQIIFGKMNPDEVPEHDEGIEAHLRSWSAGFGVPRVSVQGMDAKPEQTDELRYRPPGQDGGELKAPEAEETYRRPLVHTSFSALTTYGPGHDSGLGETEDKNEDDADIADRDQSTTASIQPAELDIEAEEPGEQVPLAQMPGGRKVGDLVHRIIEDLLNAGALGGGSFDSVQEAVLDAIDEQKKRVDVEKKWKMPLADALATCLTGALSVGSESFRLIDLPRDQFTCEMPFVLRVGERERPFEVRHLADALRHSDLENVQAYAREVERIKPKRMAGFLAGFIDLVFTVNGKWYLMDYKTNQLGPSSADYTPNRLGQAMADHDYILQYHLYLLALDRYLKQRLPGYSYEQHFGGILYLFMRGFDGKPEASQGVYRDRPNLNVLKAMSSAFMEEAP